MCKDKEITEEKLKELSKSITKHLRAIGQTKSIEVSGRFFKKDNKVLLEVTSCYNPENKDEEKIILTNTYSRYRIKGDNCLLEDRQEDVILAYRFKYLKE